MVQQFLPEIQRSGEWSLVFIGGEYSHSVRKFAAAGDFRVQTQFGGRVEAATPNLLLINTAAKTLSEIGKPPLYARLDGFERDDTFVLMELELIEPVLFLGLGEAAALFAQMIALSLENSIAASLRDFYNARRRSDDKAYFRRIVKGAI